MGNSNRKVELSISIVGIVSLVVLFIFGFGNGTAMTMPGWISGMISTVLFAWICLQFVPEWVSSWTPHTPTKSLKKIEVKEDEPLHIEVKIFATLIMFTVAIVLGVYWMRRLLGSNEGFLDSLSFWTCTDSYHYLCIARDGYLSEGEWDRLVQLVFLPGYPLAVRMLNVFVHNYLYSGMLVSAFSFAGAGCVIYRLLRLDYSHSDAIRAIKFLCILPGSFFFVAPMSESLFLLLSAGCIYCIRTKKRLLGCLLGGMAAFTRSLGIVLVVPVLYEFIVEFVESWTELKKEDAIKTVCKRWMMTLLIPAGFGMYCLINFLVSGNFFKFMEYQQKNWHQGFGWFFNTAAYQLEEAIKCASTNPHTMFGLWIPNLIAIFSSLIIMVLATKLLRPSYVAWFIAYFVIAIGATWLLSAPRYLIALITLPLAVSLLTQTKVANRLATMICLFVYPVYLYAFVMRWQVW